MNFTNLIVGPQLVGFIFFITGIIMMYFPPKKINGLYGYRTSSSMKNQQSWDEANRFSAIYMAKAGLVTIAVGIAIAGLLTIIHTQEDLSELINIMFMLFSGIGPAVLMIVATEKHLTKTFGE
jgi:uncharacterized membrane protein